MPTYEYRCTEGHDFEVVQRMTDDPVIECQVCGAPVRRVFSAPAVHFKGSGFYNTDYGTRSRAREREASNGAKGGESKGESSSGSSSEGQSESSKSSDAKSSDSKKTGATATAD